MTSFITLLARFARYLLVVGATVAMLVVSAGPAPAAAQEHHHYKLIDLGTFGGPMSRNDAIYPPLNNEGTVSGVADTTTPDPFFPNFNPALSPASASDPYIFKAFESNNGNLVALDSLPGGYSAYPGGISENGLIAGTAINGALDPITGWPEENAVFWEHGQITNLGTLGGHESTAGMVNNHGQVAGNSTNAIPDPYSFLYSLFGFSNGTQTRAFRWDRQHGMQDLGTLGGPDAAALWINERGEVAGYSLTANPSGSPTSFDPFLWEPPTSGYPDGRMIDLGSLGGTFGIEGDGVVLNNHGQVVGTSNLAGDVYSHPFLWTKPGPMQDLGTLGGNFGQANVINEGGEVAGWANNAGGAALAFFWKKGTMTNLGTLPGDACSYAFAINSREQVAGASDNDCNGGNSHAFLWENGRPMVDLNDLVSGADMTLGGATGINDRGEITGLGVLPNGDLRAFLLIPCDENHPAVEGCDYSPVEVSTVAASRTTETAPQKQLTPQEISRIRDLLMNRHRRFMPRTR